ncbi:conserved hypothetical protein [Pseudogulbenkiania ferrooxidans 2002]|uniref:Pilus assembly protein FimV n=2 Tax=Chromobacteriaceae TaxID=1499392 RepID=B9YYP9_9NEIS|nr:tetratricopeptide repeat protein [uncultured Pseudogulbenkiania sp.]EEG10252.1 conserved hypothetical protein [Pseudogulbenkiania ferrooxidans 2002]
MDVLAGLTASLVLMVAFSLLRKLWKAITYKPPKARGIDPVAEAEVFLAYGKTGEAVRVLKDVLDEDPDNMPAKVALLRAYSSNRNAKAYSQLARDVHARLHGQPVWKTIQQNGRDLDPANPLFNA